MSFWQKIFGSKQKTESCSCSPCQCNPCECEDISTILNLTSEDIENLKNLDEHVVVGKVLEVTAHSDPGITKVRVTKTDLGNGKIEQILCGGINLEAGQIVAVATIGTKLAPDFEIGIRAIGGIDSHGMICARAELGLSPASEQKGEIWEIAKNLETKLGTPLQDL